MEGLGDEWLMLAIYGLPLLLAWLYYGRKRSITTGTSQQILTNSIEQDLMQPASLHPRIEPGRCIGSGACVDACPEKNVLGMIAGRAQLITPANCIGHGACRDACPVDAIDLVIGTEKRGVEIPLVAPDFETNVPGIYIAGELGGMGLIRNGIEQGRQALDSIRARVAGRGGDALDVVIIGAGPAGLSASLAAKHHGLRYATLEQESLGGTVAHYPRGKIVMTAPVDLAGYGRVKLRETTKEALLELWEDVVAKTGVEIQFGERVEAIERQGEDFVVRSQRGEYRTHAVLLAIGRRGTPRKLGVPGEDRNKVVYRLIDPHQYRGMHVLVVGGGDSALEAAETISREPGSTVTLSYRSDAFSRAKVKNRELVEAARERGDLTVLLSSNVKEVGEEDVVLDCAGELRTIPNQAIIVCAGGVLPTAFLKAVGIEVAVRRGEVL